MFSIDRHYQTMPIAHLQFFEDSSVVFVNRYIPKFGWYILSIRLKLRIPDESGHHSGGKAATVPTGNRPAFRFDCGHHSGAIRPV
ncbi:hypothetical protein [Geobacter benzoatilyticus]|uniref:Uncharacterized protein n=1 Tax=Geobacter benzoatilyticus TaxID=2815309 RepID=A0ABX7Q179_9BACT|nr:hypothetical protein [Geobacter benzoatilyticus]QSV44972.1 hypothetical protein JZM60_12550 [Geobacter benzoatilyticus]